MSSRFDPPSESQQPEPGAPQIDISKRYDVYYCERDLYVVVYRNALFKGVRSLFRSSEYDTWSEYLELEQTNGQTVFLHRPGVVGFCAPGTQLTGELVRRK
jgi:hypothetical protein